MSLKQKKIGFIGGGNMAEALLSGLLRSKKARASNITVSEPNTKRRQALKKRFKVAIVSDNQKLVRNSDVIVLAVKPQVMSAVLTDIAQVVKNTHLIISIAAGVDTRFLYRYLGNKTRLIRVMPNTPALVGQGITGLFAGRSARNSDLKIARALFESVGTSLVLKREAQLDWVTAVSGSGPAYVFLFLEALIGAALKGGLTRAQARELALATTQGAATLAAAQDEELGTLRKRVTSKGGTTEAALKILNKKNWAKTLGLAVQAAAQRAQELRK